VKFDPRTDPDVPQGMSVELLQDLHLLTRDGHLNADARRKLKQIRHLVGLLRPALDDALARTPDPLVVDCGAGKSYLGAMLYELVLGPAGRGSLTAIEARPELSEQAAKRAARFGQERFRVATGAIGSFVASPPSATSTSSEPTTRCTRATRRPTTRSSSRLPSRPITSRSCRAARRKSRASSRPRSRATRSMPRCSHIRCTAASSART
jgi:hypothetical protein